MNEYILVITCTAIIYFSILTGIIFFGKKELSQLSIIDLVFVLLISSAVQNAMVNGDWNSLYVGLVSALTLFVINYSMKLLIFKSKTISQFVEGDPVILIYRGKLVEENLKIQRITYNEIETAVREHGVAEISKVNLAMLETDGNISVISYEEKKATLFKRKKKVPARMLRG